ncbi:hypothetical protein [Herbiconiux sp.]|uniref:hypothetical protein n=1 Tax=Herbiconiux sp. TaxID=1871186 RepID=UPI0025C3AF9C|nr:hypothetical protein [Herbiconiux sp.]
MRDPAPLPEELRERAFSLESGRSLGLSRKRMLASGLDIPFRGVRAANDLNDVRARCEAYSSRMLPQHCFSHVTAALLWGVPLPRPLEARAAIDVSALHGRTRPRMRGVLGHELSGQQVHVVRRHGLPVTDPITTWLQLAAVLADAWLVAAGEHLVLDPIVRDPRDPRPHARLEEFAERIRSFDGRGAAKARRALSRMRLGVESPRETFLRLDLLAAGLPEPEVNGEIRDAQGRLIAIGDLVYRPQMVLVEYDGDHHRTDSRQYRRDIERQDLLVELGWRRIRVGRDFPRTGPRSAVERTRAALSRSSTRQFVPLRGRRKGTK